MHIANNILELIGNTPLLRIDDYQATIYAKIESFNPASCVKERIAQIMIDDALASGRINQQTTLIEATSGNTGIGLAMVAASKSMRLILTMPENMSLERRSLLALMGATIVLTPKEQGMKGAISRAEELQRTIDNSFIVDQFNNPLNTEAHFRTTGPEIIAQLGSKNCDFFIAGVGTGGTISGTGKALKQHNPNVKIIAVEPKDSPVLSGGKPAAHKIQGIGAGFIPKNLDQTILDSVETVSYDEAIETLLTTAKQRGLLIGISSAAALSVAIHTAQRIENKGKNIVVILPDSAERYLSVLSEEISHQ